MKAAKADRFRACWVAVRMVVVMVMMIGSGCSHEPPPPPSRAAAPTPSVHTPEIDTPRHLETKVGPYHASLGHGAELYLPPSFAPRKGGYDLIVHFHGEGRWQQANIEHAQLNVAVVSVNLGMGTEPYSNAFKSPDAFDRLLGDTQSEIVKSGRADGAKLHRIALSAWSAGFSSIARLMTDSVAERVDAILLADGFFTYFTDPKKRTVNAQGLEKFAHFADLARRDEKLFAITHTTIPTGPYPSVQECVTKLLDMIGLAKTPAAAIGPHNMRQFYAVDEGSFHIRGFEGTEASDHVKQLHAMGETMYPWLKARWDKQDEQASPTTKPVSPSSAPQPHAAP